MNDNILYIYVCIVDSNSDNIIYDIQTSDCASFISTFKSAYSVPTLCSFWVQQAGCPREKTMYLQRRVWWPKRIGTKTGILVSKRHLTTITMHMYYPRLGCCLCFVLCLCYHKELLYFCGMFDPLQTLPTTSALLGNLLTNLLITSMPPCWQ